MKLFSKPKPVMEDDQENRVDCIISYERVTFDEGVLVRTISARKNTTAKDKTYAYYFLAKMQYVRELSSKLTCCPITASRGAFEWVKLSELNRKQKRSLMKNGVLVSDFQIISKLSDTFPWQKRNFKSLPASAEMDPWLDGDDWREAFLPAVKSACSVYMILMILLTADTLLIDYLMENKNYPVFHKFHKKNLVYSTLTAIIIGILDLKVRRVRPDLGGLKGFMKEQLKDSCKFVVNLFYRPEAEVQDNLDVEGVRLIR